MDAICLSNTVQQFRCGSQSHQKDCGVRGVGSTGHMEDLFLSVKHEDMIVDKWALNGVTGPDYPQIHHE